MRGETSEVTMGDWQLGHQGQTRPASRLGHHTQASAARLPRGLKNGDVNFNEERKMAICIILFHLMEVSLLLEALLF